MGKVHQATPVRSIFQIETTLNTNTFGADGPLAMLQKREWEWTAKDRAAYRRHAGNGAQGHAAARLKRKVFQLVASAARADERSRPARSRRCTRITTENGLRQQLVPVEGQTDILTMGHAVHVPVQRQLDDEPDPGDGALGLGYFFNLYRNKPLVREGGVLIMTSPHVPWEFHPVHHPSYIDFFEQVLADTTDPGRDVEASTRSSFAEDEWYRHLYRTSYAYHGVHPFYMWYWGAHGHAATAGKRDHRRRRRTEAVRRLGFTPAIHDGRMRSRSPADVVGRTPTVTHLHVPAHAGGRRLVEASLEGRPRRPRGSTLRRAGKRRRPWSSAPPVALAAQAGRNKLGFPYPRRRRCRSGVEVPVDPPVKLGADYDTDWGPLGHRRQRVARSVINRGPAAADAVKRASPTRRSSGVDRLADLRSRANRRRRTAAAGHLRPQPPQPCRHGR